MEETNVKKPQLFAPSNADQYVYANIIFVDTENNVLDAIGSDGLRFIKNCQYLSVNPDVSGEIRHPSSGDTCVIKIASDGSCYLDKLYTVANVDENGVPQRKLGPYGKYMPGDRVFLSKGGAFLGLLRNGMVKIGSSPICQLIFMRLENYVRLISRNIEILGSGFRFYSVNDKGVNVSRLSIFLQDALSKNLRNKTSEASDFEFVVKDRALSLMMGPKDEKTGLRINTTVLTFVDNGSIILYNYDKESGAVLQKVTYTPNGCSEHIIYDGNNTAIYQKIINRNPTNIDPKVIVNEKINGEYNLVVEGHAAITASKDLTVNGKNIFSVAEQTHSTQCNAQLVDAKIKG